VALLTKHNAGLVEYLWIAGAVVIVVAVVLLLVSLGGKRNMLAPTIAGAVGAFLLVSGWLYIVDNNVAKNEAIKTGGLAGGSVIALYALWLNDRRRRTDEARQEIELRRQKLEDQRAEHDRSRVADERFARAVELLGHETDQVRVGALHALAGLARSRAEYTQTVLDILCAYLRRPFVLNGKPDESELQVRQTAQRLIGNLLPKVDEQDAPHYDLDLTKATLEYMDLSYCQIGNFYARAANFYASNALHHAKIYGEAYLTGSVTHGKLHMHHMVFSRKAGFSNFIAHADVDFSATDFQGDTKFAHGTYASHVSFADAKFHKPIELKFVQFLGGLDMRLALTNVANTHAMKVALDKENHLPNGWVVDKRDDETGLVRS
jgi:hypothetical protein